MCGILPLTSYSSTAFERWLTDTKPIKIDNRKASITSNASSTPLDQSQAPPSPPLSNPTLSSTTGASESTIAGGMARDRRDSDEWGVFLFSYLAVYPSLISSCHVFFLSLHIWQYFTSSLSHTLTWTPQTQAKSLPPVSKSAKDQSMRSPARATATLTPITQQNFTKSTQRRDTLTFSKRRRINKQIRSGRRGRRRRLGLYSWPTTKTEFSWGVKGPLFTNLKKLWLEFFALHSWT